jgi:UDP-N-acetylglucosamine--dolichyl-phosphate N-acetylglucosaminephosphotransferase
VALAPNFFVISTVAVIISFVTTFLCIGPLIKKLGAANIVGIDVHKRDKPRIPEMGGIAIIIGFVISLNSVLVLISHPRIDYILAATVTIFLTAFVGIIDDLTGLTQRWKPVLVALAAAPLIIIRVGYSTVFLPFLGFVDLGLIYWFIVVPIGISGAANGFNSLAGFNGLEAGLGCIMSFFLMVEALILGVSETVLIMASLFGACLAFSYFNKYPARIFPGDTGTLTIGAVIASAVIIGRMEWIGVTVFIPHIINYGLVFGTSRRLTSSWEFQPTKIMPDGTLASSDSMNLRVTLADVILKIRRIREPNIVRLLWAFEFAACILSLVVTFYYAKLF